MMLLPSSRASWSYCSSWWPAETWFSLIASSSLPSLPLNCFLLLCVRDLVVVVCGCLRDQLSFSWFRWELLDWCCFRAYCNCLNHRLHRVGLHLCCDRLVHRVNMIARVGAVLCLCLTADIVVVRSGVQVEAWRMCSADRLWCDHYLLGRWRSGCNVVVMTWFPCRKWPEQPHDQDDVHDHIVLIHYVRAPHCFYAAQVILYELAENFLQRLIGCDWFDAAQVILVELGESYIHCLLCYE